jgi:hypothetical protein
MSHLNTSQPTQIPAATSATAAARIALISQTLRRLVPSRSYTSDSRRIRFRLFAFQPEVEEVSE